MWYALVVVLVLISLFVAFRFGLAMDRLMVRDYESQGNPAPEPERQSLGE